MINSKHKFRSLVLVLLLTPICHLATGQKKAMYAYSDIPENLLNNSNAVIREDIAEFEIIEVGKGKSYIKMAVTILNKKADHYAEMRVGYDKLNKITLLKAHTFDKTGQLITTLKNKDIEDYSSFDGFSIYTDNRMKYFDLRHPEYPYTIEYEYEIQKDGFISLQDWVPFSGFNVSSQKSSLKIMAPENYDIRYLELNLDPTAKENIVDGKKTISWKFDGFESITHEPKMNHLQSILPQVLTAPSDFKMEEYQGNMADWASFALWEKMLNEGRDELPENFKQKIKALVSHDTSRVQKIKHIYEYLQANTRYVSIQLGIGGWQSFPAVEVAENGYGDCKALSNYMKSMLKAVDIESNYTLVYAGAGKSNIVTQFPSNQFNHMILCVPNQQDTIWLECTSQDNPFGYLGNFTGDRDVLVINETGGKITRTKTYSKEENIQNQNALVVVDEKGAATVALSISCTGLQYENLSRLIDIGETKQKKWLHSNLDLPGFKLIDFNIQEKKLIIPEVHATINISMDRIASVSGKRIFIQPNLFNKFNSISIPQKERKYEMVLDYTYMDTDTIEYHIPTGYHLEYIPEVVSIDSPFGKYRSQIISEEGKIFYIRNCSKVKGVFPPESYLEYVDFINKIAEADKAKIVLVKST